MIISCKGINEKDGEIQFTRIEGQLIVSILNSHGETFYTMTHEEIESLMVFLKISDDWMD
jgi:hypothetical protein